MPRLYIASPAPHLAGFRVELNGVEVTKLVDVPLPVDLDVQHVVARSTNMQAQTFEVDVAEETKVYEVTLAPFQPAPEPVGTVEPHPQPTITTITNHTTNSGRTWSYIGGGTGVVSLAVGIGFGFHARSQSHSAKAGPHCFSDNSCDDTGTGLINNAFGTAGMSTILVGIGVAGVAAGTFLWFRTRGHDQSGIAIAPTIDAHSVGLTFAGPL